MADTPPPGLTGPQWTALTAGKTTAEKDALRQLMASSGEGSDQYKGKVWIHKRDASGKIFGSDPDLVAVLPQRWALGKTAKDKRAYTKFIGAVSDAVGHHVTSFDEALDVWQLAVKKATGSWAATLGGTRGGNPNDPFAELSRAATDRKNGIANSLVNSVTGTVTHKTITDVGPGDAWSSINGAASRLLGRAATPGEVQEFAHKAHQIAANNPTYSTTTTDPVTGNETTKTKGGYSANDLDLAAANEANSDPEAGAYQAAGPLYNAFLSAISNPFELG